MTRITIETTIDGSDEIMKSVVEYSQTAVTLDYMAGLVTQAINGLGFHVKETVFETEYPDFDDGAMDCKPEERE